MENPIFKFLSKKSKKSSKFINHRLIIGGEFIGIYKAVREASNRYGETLHYVFDEGDRELIFDSNNHKIAQIFAESSFGSRFSIKKIFKNGKMFYEVNYLNCYQDEVAHAFKANNKILW